MRIQLLLVLCVLMSNVLSAQISFTEKESEITDEFRSGAAIVSIDMNGDGLDDLLRLSSGVEVHVDLQSATSGFINIFSENIAGNPQWNLIAGDMNNDGWVDIVASGISDRVKVLEAMPFSSEFKSSVIDDTRFFAQGSNLADVNNDGLLDIFVCNDDALNRLYINIGPDGFERRDDIIDFNTDPISDNSGNYGSTWCDFDNDGDLDLHIAKCRIGVFEPTDPRRINLLYVNTDTGFTELADSYGLANGAQSWSADFGDIDNDGDFDIIMINHDVPSQLFENIENDTFVDITAASGIDIQGNNIQSILRDFDNDGLIDLIVSGSSPKLYRNIGNNQFEEVVDPFPGDNISSFTIGDFNSDGYPDVYTSYNRLYNTPSNIDDDKIWFNDGGTNNYARIKAIGSNVNKSAVGAKLMVHGAWGMQMREIRAGESYGIATATIQNFGLGTAESIDSLVVIWPNGLRESHTSLSVNATITVVEGACATELVYLDQGPYVLCDFEAKTITAPEGYTEYLWSNGETSQNIQVVMPGLYHVSLTDDNGCLSVSTPCLVQMNMESDEDGILVDGNDLNCYGESVILQAPEGLAYIWSTGDTTPSIEAIETGNYLVEVTRNCSDYMTEPVSLTFLNPNELAYENDTIIAMGSGTLTADGDNVNWYENIGDTIAFWNGNTFVTPIVDTSTTYYVEQSLTLPGGSFSVGMLEHEGSKYSPEEFNGGLIFNANADFRLDSVMVYTDFSGLRSVILRDENANVISRATMQIDSGIQWITLDFDVQVGSNYILTTDADTNLVSFGVNSPLMVRSDDLVDFPYMVEDIVEIIDSEFGQEYYYYFFNWQITSADSYCTSEQRPVQVVVTDTSSSVVQLSAGQFKVYPNPTSDDLYVEVESTVDFGSRVNYYVRSIDGKLVASGFWQQGQPISLRTVTDGMYFVELRSDAISGTVKVVVARE